MKIPSPKAFLGMIVMIALVAAIALYALHPFPKPLPESQVQPFASEPKMKTVAGSGFGPTGNACKDIRQVTNPWTAQLHAWSAETDAGTRNRMMQDLLASLTSSNAAEVVKSLPAELLDTPLGVAGLELWAGSDRRAAADWLAGQTNVTQAEVGAVVHQWWAYDQAEFKNFCDQLPAGEFRQLALGTASRSELGRNPHLALDWAQQMSPDDRRTGLLQTSMEQWIQIDTVAALNWLEQVEDANLRELLIASAARGYAGVDPVQAVEWVLEFVRSNDALDQAVYGITQAWAVRDPHSAGEWLSQFPKGKQRDTGLQNLLIAWKYNDPSAAQSWIARLPQGDFKNEVETMFIKTNPGEVP